MVNHGGRALSEKVVLVAGATAARGVRSRSSWAEPALTCTRPVAAAVWRGDPRSTDPSGRGVEEFR